MKIFVCLTLFILLFQGCSNSENSSSNENSTELREESTEKEMIKESDTAKETISEDNSGEELIDPNLLESESQPYDITSYFKFFIRDIEEANRVLNTKWDPGLRGADLNYKDQLDILDKKAGYMKIVTPVPDGFIYTEYVYWNLSDGRKLFAMNKVSLEPFSGEVTTSKFDFKVFSENRWESADIGFLQTIIDEIDPTKPKEVVKSEVIRSVFDLPKEISPETHFNFKLALPQKGKDISFWLNHSEGAEMISSEKIILKFNDGRFEYQP